MLLTKALEQVRQSLNYLDNDSYHPRPILGPLLRIHHIKRSAHLLDC